MISKGNQIKTNNITSFFVFPRKKGKNHFLVGTNTGKIYLFTDIRVMYTNAVENEKGPYWTALFTGSKSFDFCNEKVTKISCSSDEKYIFASSDTKLHVMDIKDTLKSKNLCMTTYTNAKVKIQFDTIRDGQELLVQTKRNQIQLRNVNTKFVKLRIKTPDDISTFCVNTNNTFLAVASGKKIFVYDLDDGQLVQVIRIIEAIRIIKFSKGIPGILSVLKSNKIILSKLKPLNKAFFDQFDKFVYFKKRYYGVRRNNTRTSVLKDELKLYLPDGIFNLLKQHKDVDVNNVRKYPQIIQLPSTPSLPKTPNKRKCEGSEHTPPTKKIKNNQTIERAIKEKSNQDKIVGDIVMANFEGKGKFYKAYTTCCHSDGTYDLYYPEDGQREKNVSRKNIHYNPDYREPVELCKNIINNYLGKSELNILPMSQIRDECKNLKILYTDKCTKQELIDKILLEDRKLWIRILQRVYKFVQYLSPSVQGVIVETFRLMLEYKERGTVLQRINSDTSKHNNKLVLENKRLLTKTKKYEVQLISKQQELQKTKDECEKKIQENSAHCEDQIVIVEKHYKQEMKKKCDEMFKQLDEHVQNVAFIKKKLEQKQHECFKLQEAAKLMKTERKKLIDANIKAIQTIHTEKIQAIQKHHVEEIKAIETKHAQINHRVQLAAKDVLLKSFKSLEQALFSYKAQ